MILHIKEYCGYITPVNGLSGSFLDKINLLLKELFTCIEILGKYSKFMDCSLINNTYGYKHHINIFDKDLMVNLLTIRLIQLKL